MSIANASAQPARNASPLDDVNARSEAKWKDTGVPTFGKVVATGTDAAGKAGRVGEVYLSKPTMSTFIFSGRKSYQSKLDLFHAQRSAKHRDRIALELQSDPLNTKSIKHSLAILSKLDLKRQESSQRAYLAHSKPEEATQQAKTLSAKLAAMVEDATAWSADEALLKDMAQTLREAWRLEGKGEGDKWTARSDVGDYAELGVLVQHSAHSSFAERASAAAVARFAMHRDLVRSELQQGAPDMDKIHGSLQVLENLWLSGIRPQAQSIDSFETGVLEQSFVTYAKSRAVVDVSIDTRFNEAQKQVLNALLDSWDPVNRQINPGILGEIPGLATLEKDKEKAGLALDKAHLLGLGRQDAIKTMNAARARLEFGKIADERLKGYVRKPVAKAATQVAVKRDQMTHALTLREPAKTPEDLKAAIGDCALDLHEAQLEVNRARDQLSQATGQSAKQELKAHEAKLEDLQKQYKELRSELLPLLPFSERNTFTQQYPLDFGTPS